MSLSSPIRELAGQHLDIMPNPADDPGVIALAQRQLAREGYKVGAADGKLGPVTRAALIQWADANGLAIKLPPPAPALWPADTFHAMTAYYGPHGIPDGREPDLVWFNMPYPMRLYDTNKVLKRHRCHRLVKTSLEAVLETARDKLGIEFIQAHRLDRFFGCYMPRNSRNSKRLSTHAWAAAIDIDATHNQNMQRWEKNKIGQEGYATMPVEFIEIFETFGWKSGARAWGRDAMHFQATL